MSERELKYMTREEAPKGSFTVDHGEHVEFVLAAVNGALKARNLELAFVDLPDKECSATYTVVLLDKGAEELHQRREVREFSRRWVAPDKQ